MVMPPLALFTSGTAYSATRVFNLLVSGPQTQLVATLPLTGENHPYRKERDAPATVLVLVLMLMQVRVAVHEFLMSVGVFMNKVSPEEKIGVEKEIFRLTVGNNVMFGSYYKYTTSNLFH